MICHLSSLISHRSSLLRLQSFAGNVHTCPLKSGDSVNTHILVGCCMGLLGSGVQCGPGRCGHFGRTPHNCRCGRCATFPRPLSAVVAAACRPLCGRCAAAVRLLCGRCAAVVCGRCTAVVCGRCAAAVCGRSVWLFCTDVRCSRCAVVGWHWAMRMPVGGSPLVRPPRTTAAATRRRWRPAAVD